MIQVYNNNTKLSEQKSLSAWAEVRKAAARYPRQIENRH
jgi:hypothetical protein